MGIDWYTNPLGQMQPKEVLSFEIVDSPPQGRVQLLLPLEEKEPTLGNNALAQFSLCKSKINTEFFFLYRKALTFKMTQTHSLVSCEIWNLEVLSYFQVSFRTLLAKSDAWTTREKTIPEMHPYSKIKQPETEVSLPPGLRPFQTWLEQPGKKLHYSYHAMTRLLEVYWKFISENPVILQYCNS